MKNEKEKILAECQVQLVLLASILGTLEKMASGYESREQDLTDEEKHQLEYIRIIKEDYEAENAIWAKKAFKLLD